MSNRMPREIAPGVFWIGDCLAQRHKGKIYHGYNAAFLVAGETASCLVETGHPKDFPVIERHMNELFARGVAPLKYLFVTHQETPHCGGLGRVLKTHPDALLCGDVSDYHLAFPQYDQLIERLGVKTIAPTHGLPITDVKATVPKVQAGLKAAALMPESGTNEKVAAAS